MVVELITNPDAFMERKVQKPSLWREGIVVFLSGALGSIGLFYMIQQFLSVHDSSGYTPFNAFAVFAEPVFGIFALWILYSVLGHFIADRMHARGPIKRVIKLSAWALIPVGIGNLVRSIAIFLAYRNFDPADISFEEDGFHAQLAEFTELHMTDPIVLVGTAVLIATAVWSGYLLALALEDAKKGLSFDDARKVAAIPSGIFVLYLVWQTAVSLGVL